MSGLQIQPGKFSQLSLMQGPLIVGTGFWDIKSYHSQKRTPTSTGGGQGFGVYENVRMERYKEWYWYLFRPLHYAISRQNPKPSFKPLSVVLLVPFVKLAGLWFGVLGF